jgi:hypothetical protein
LPKRFFRETLAGGKGIYTEEEFGSLIDEYYQLRGWDINGNPPLPAGNGVSSSPGQSHSLGESSKDVRRANISRE